MGIENKDNIWNVNTEKDNIMNILLTSSGRRGYMVRYFKEALNGEGKVFTANSDEKVSSFIFADKTVITPLIYDADYIPFLLDYCKKNDIKLIVPLFDIDLYILSLNKKLFEEQGTFVLVSSPEVIEKCNDKWKTKLFLQENGFDYPKTVLSIEDAKKELQFPVIIKPRWGMGSIAIFDAENKEEFDILYSKTKKQIKNSYLKYESKQNFDDCILTQEKISGQEYGLDIINDLQGNYQNTIVKKKYSMRAGETDSAQIIRDAELEKLGKEISAKLGHIGNLDVDVIKSEDKHLYVLEMNARFGGGYPFTHCAGVNLPQAIIDWVNDKPVDKRRFCPKENVIAYKDINIVINN